jgi:hypothetical protein
MKKVELCGCSAEQLLDMGLDVASCVRFMEWIVEKERERFGETSYCRILNAAVVRGKTALRLLEYTASVRKDGAI